MRVNKLIVSIITFSMMLCLAITSAWAQAAHSYKPPLGFVPDAKTAIAIAHAVAIPIYGETNISKQLPLTATLEDAKWIVYGTFNGSKYEKGGVVVVEIEKTTGSIFRISHGK